MNFVPYDKLSKKKKRALDRARRGGWGALSPVTRREENPKAYKRKKIRLSDAGEADLFRGARPGQKRKPRSEGPKSSTRPEAKSAASVFERRRHGAQMRKRQSQMRLPFSSRAEWSPTRRRPGGLILSF